MINEIKARLGSLSPRKLEEIYKISPAVHKLLTVDLPALIKQVEESVK